MAEYKLIHFNTRFLAEPIRFIFAYRNVPYEDCRVTVDEWNKMRETEEIPWNQLPILVLSDGRKMGQSSAISDYVARKLDLCGLDEWDAARCKEISGSMRDLRQEWRKFFFQKNKERRRELKNNFIENIVPRYFGQLSRMMVNTGGDWLVCDVITWADLLVAHTIGFIQDSVDQTVLDAYANLVDLKNRIWETPQIKHWIKTRPKPDLTMLYVIPMNV